MMEIEVALGIQEGMDSTAASDVFDPIQQFKRVDPVQYLQLKHGRGYLQMCTNGAELLKSLK